MQRVCHPCYGVLPETACCNSCEQLILLFAFKRMAPDPDHWPQCKSQGAPPQVSLDEKCLVKGKISVNKVAGGFHIAPGRNDMNANGGHNHDLSGAFPSLDLSHRIERVRFGPDIPTANTPLTGVRVRPKVSRPMRYRYILMATPLVYMKNGYEKARGYEYTVMIASRPILPGMAPGIFFDYSFTPYGVVVNAASRSFAQYLTSTFGFLAGAFAMVMMFDAFLHETGLVQKITKPNENK
jgi:hypothetical protein